MTTEEKINRLNNMCDSSYLCDSCPLFKLDRAYCYFDRLDPDTLDKVYDIVFPTTATEEPHIKDSGERRQFDTGAVRDIQEGKGRCDLMPLGVIGEIVNKKYDEYTGSVLLAIADFQAHGCYAHLRRALSHFISLEECSFDGFSDMFLEVAKHFEEGAKKYGENNWQKGIPTHCYIDSAVRHYLKWLRGDKDEPHDRAFCWNILCCIWTCQNKPELNDYRKMNEDTLWTI